MLRILRLIGRHDGLKVACRALIQSLPSILNITLIMFIFFLLFAVISVSEFKGKFYYCSKEINTDMNINHKWDCLNAGGIWINQIYCFDNIPRAMITLFIMSTSAGWQDILLNSITSTDIDYVSSSSKNVFWSLFFILFLIIGFFFFLNLFMGVVVSTFNSE
jgi:hypothetical protein